MAFHEVDDLFGRIGLEVTDDVSEVGRFDDQVQVILQNDIAKQFKTSLALQISPEVKDDACGVRAREDRQPADDCAGNKVRVALLENSVASSRH